MKIVILPGLDGTGNLLGAFSGALRIRYPIEVVSYPAGMSSYDELRVWLNERLPTDDYVIVAESFSGPLAIEIAAQKPKTLRGVIFVASFARRPRRIHWRIVKLLKVLPYFPSLVAKLSKPFVIGRAGPDDFNAAYSATLQQLPYGTIIDRLCAVLRVNVVSKLNLISVPCVYVSASRDVLVPSSVSSDFVELCGQPISVDGPHFVLQTHPEETANHVLRFVTERVDTMKP